MVGYGSLVLVGVGYGCNGFYWTATFSNWWCSLSANAQSSSTEKMWLQLSLIYEIDWKWLEHQWWLPQVIIIRFKGWETSEYVAIIIENSWPKDIGTLWDDHHVAAALILVEPPTVTSPYPNELPKESAWGCTRYRWMPAYQQKQKQIIVDFTTSSTTPQLQREAVCLDPAPRGHPLHPPLRLWMNLAFSFMNAASWERETAQKPQLGSCGSRLVSLLVFPTVSPPPLRQPLT